ncbi:HEXXH motif domain-containing protein [Nonomuraea insulae]|uniref:HEXXH motif domain-containing protein n=1 Tax=Nonomuraea insulae TaxID=1616787 RepID=A0ABW1DFS8_9ACTN
MFNAMAQGGGGTEAVGHLLPAQYSKRLLLLRGIRAGAGSESYALLARIQERDPAAVGTVIRYPTVTVWARRALLGDGDSVPELASLAAAAAVRAGFPGEFEVAVKDGVVMLPSLGRALLPGGDGPAVVRVKDGRATVSAGESSVPIPAEPYGDAPGWQGLRRLSAEHQGAGVRFLLDDIDPDRMPGAEVPPGRLIPEEVAQWQSTLHRAWELLVRRHWTAAQEIAGLVTVLTPLAATENGISSATPYQAFGSIGLSNPPDHHLFAVTLAHEAQHTKLTALLDLVALTRPDDDGRRFYAPWRDDPRPIAGLLQGVYAHLGIAGFWRRQRAHESGAPALRADTDFARWRAAAGQTARVIAASGLLTPAGEQFVAATSRTLDDWSREPVSADAQAAADEANQDHLSRWRLRNGEI